jgi:hypothetical protein
VDVCGLQWQNAGNVQQLDELHAASVAETETVRVIRLAHRLSDAAVVQLAPEMLAYQNQQTAILQLRGVLNDVFSSTEPMASPLAEDSAVFSAFQLNDPIHNAAKSTVKPTQ